MKSLVLAMVMCMVSGVTCYAVEPLLVPAPAKPKLQYNPAPTIPSNVGAGSNGGKITVTAPPKPNPIVPPLSTPPAKSAIIPPLPLPPEPIVFPLPNVPAAEQSVVKEEVAKNAKFWEQYYRAQKKARESSLYQETGGFTVEVDHGNGAKMAKQERSIVHASNEGIKDAVQIGREQQRARDNAFNQALDSMDATPHAVPVPYPEPYPVAVPAPYPVPVYPAPVYRRYYSYGW